MAEEYIKRKAVLAEYDRVHVGPASGARKLIENFPASDVVEIVRCRDCAVPHNRWTGCPKLSGLVTPPDFYCGFGDRKK